MEIRRLEINGGISRLPHIQQAANVFRKLTTYSRNNVWEMSPHSNLVNRAFLLGKNEKPITSSTYVLGPEHIPQVEEMYESSYRNAVLGFFAGIEKLEGGIEWLGSMTSKMSVVVAEDIIRNFVEEEMPEYIGSGYGGWPINSEICGQLTKLSDNTLLRLGWFLRDISRETPEGIVNSFEEISKYSWLKNGRLKVDPETAVKVLDNDQLVRIMGLGIRKGKRVNRYGDIHTYDLNHDGFGKVRGTFMPSAFLPVDKIIKGENGNFELWVQFILNPGQPFGKFEYSPAELEYVQLTKAEAPKIK